MIPLILITGFLGAGKTTFLKQLARQLKVENLAILVNEFGREDVDGLLLEETRARLEEVHSGSIFCACRLEQFEQGLRRLAEGKPDAILVETSGLSDPTGVRSLFDETGRFPGIQYRGCFCLADAVRFEKVYATARVCARQVEVCDAVILNKSDLADQEQRKRTRALIEAQRPGIPIFETSYGAFREEWLGALRGGALSEGPAGIHTRDLSLQSRLITLKDSFPPDRLREFLSRFAEHAYRIKGFARLGGETLLVDAVGDTINVVPWSGPTENVNRLVALSGQGLPMTAAIRRACRDFAPYIDHVE